MTADLRLPGGQGRPAWGTIFGALPAAWVFLDPWQRRAAPFEWAVTAVLYAAFLALCALCAIYWSRPRIVARVLIAMTTLAIIFMAYRPSGAAIFLFVAAYSPWAVRGHSGRSAMLIGGVVLLLAVEWLLLYPPDTLPLVIGAASVLLGLGAAFSTRQQIAVARANRTAERERIARDLHDVLGHTLSVVVLKSELAGRLVHAAPERARTELADIERISRRALSEVRETISGYRAGSLGEELERAVATLAAAGVAVTRHRGDVDLAPAHERVLALVLREAVTNVVRHAQARHCVLTLEASGDLCRLVVRDDGRGGVHREGLGMRGIRERIAALDGKVAWHDEEGTVLTIAVPLVAKGPPDD